MQRHYASDAARWIAGLELLPHRARPFFLRLSGVSHGPRFLVYAGLRIDGSSPFVVGEDVFVNRSCFIDLSASVAIGDGARIGDHVRVITSTHDLGSSDRRAGRGLSLPLRIGRGAWIGSGVTLLPGADVADGCVIAAGAVVTKPTRVNGLYAGVPARRIRDLA